MLATSHPPLLLSVEPQVAGLEVVLSKAFLMFISVTSFFFGQFIIPVLNLMAGKVQVYTDLILSI